MSIIDPLDSLTDFAQDLTVLPLSDEVTMQIHPMRHLTCHKVDSSSEAILGWEPQDVLRVLRVWSVSQKYIIII